MKICRNFCIICCILLYNLSKLNQTSKSYMKKCYRVYIYPIFRLENQYTLVSMTNYTYIQNFSSLGLLISSLILDTHKQTTNVFFIYDPSVSVASRWITLPQRPLRCLLFIRFRYYTSQLTAASTALLSSTYHSL